MRKELILLGGDVLLILTAFYLAPVLRFGVFLDFAFIFGWPDLSAALITLTCLYIFDFYRLEDRILSFGYAVRFVAAIAVADLFIATLFYAFGVRPYATEILLLNSLMIFSFCLGWRILFYRLGRQMQKVSRVLVIGAGASGRELQKLLADREDFTIEGFLDDDPGKWGKRMGPADILGGMDLLPSLLDRIDILIVAITKKIRQDLYGQIVEAKMRGVVVYEMPAFCERVLEKIPVRHISDLWFLHVPISGVRKNMYNQKIKWIADLILSFVGLLVTLPVMLAAALAVRLESPGPVFYVHRRIGLNGRPFNLVKLRTMKAGMENDRQNAGRKDDPRITRAGRVLRLFRIDEIPQMWNVIRGDMSFIGPRALIEEEVKEFSPKIPYFSLRHSVRPGITGWAQVNYPHGAKLEDALAKLEYDLYYIKNLSPLLDLRILARTVRTVLFARGK